MRYQALKRKPIFLKNRQNGLIKIKAVLVDSVQGKIKLLQADPDLILWEHVLFKEDGIKALKSTERIEKKDQLFDIINYRAVDLNDREIGVLEDYDFDQISGRILRYFIRPNSFLKKVIEGSLILNLKDIIRINPAQKEIIVRDIERRGRFKLLNPDKIPAKAIGTV